MVHSGEKRKRDVDCPRITYDTSTRLFERLFEGDEQVKFIFLADVAEPCLEESLEEMKNVVRKKLGLHSSIPVHLSQLRVGRTIDLEDGIYLNLLFYHIGLNNSYLSLR